MSETFKINIYFDEKGEELEGLIKHIIINILKKDIDNFLTSNYNGYSDKRRNGLITRKKSVIFLNKYF